jgi:hypothetical protein
LQPPYVHHCNICGQCVLMVDHHCPWINNCVGYFNQKCFVLFNAYGLTTLLYSCILLYRRLFYELFGATSVSQLDFSFPVVASSLFLIVLASLFIIVVLCDQLVIITNRLSPLDRIRLDQIRLNKNKVKKRGLANFTYTFGAPSLAWVLPVPIAKSVTFESLY